MIVIISWGWVRDGTFEEKKVRKTAEKTGPEVLRELGKSESEVSTTRGRRRGGNFEYGGQADGRNFTTVCGSRVEGRYCECWTH